MVKTLLLPSFLLFAGLVLLGFAMLAPPARKRIVPARERVRGLERVASTRPARANCGAHLMTLIPRLQRWPQFCCGITILRAHFPWRR